MTPPVEQVGNSDESASPHPLPCSEKRSGGTKKLKAKTRLTVTPHLTLTVTPDLILKMTAAEVVETSVTTIKSLAKDFTNLNDQPSQTLTDTPGFNHLLYTSSVRLRFILRANVLYFVYNFRHTNRACSR